MEPKRSKLQKSKDDPFSGYWLRQADAQFGKLWHAIPRHCKVCGLPAELAHLIPRENYLHRWDPANPFPLCDKHHRFDRLLSCHGSPTAFGIWLAINYPKQARYVLDHKNIITRKIELPFTFREVAEALGQVQTLDEWEREYKAFMAGHVGLKEAICTND